MHGTAKATAVLALLAAATGAHAVELAEGKLNIAGFGRWAYGNTDGNSFLVGRDAGKADNVGVALNIFARPTDRLAVATQIFWDNTKVNIDWAFAEWRFSDALRLRAGQVKMPFGAYWEVKDVGTLRPFFNLPVSVYQFSDLAAESYFGAGLTGNLPVVAGFDVSYDLYGGSMWVESNDRFRAAPPPPQNPPAPPPYASSTSGPQLISTRLDNTFGGRLTVGFPVPGLTARLSGYRGEVARITNGVVDLQQGASPETPFYAYGVSLEYLSEWLEVRSEAFQKTETFDNDQRTGDAFLDENEQTTRTAYVEVAVRFLEHLQLAGRAEVAQYDLASGAFTRWDPPGQPANVYTVPDSLTEHRELALGLNYWFNRDLVVKLSYHNVEGNRFAVPEYAWNTYTTDGSAIQLADIDYAKTTTNLVLVGAQFSF